MPPSDPSYTAPNEVTGVSNDGLGGLEILANASTRTTEAKGKNKRKAPCSKVESTTTSESCCICLTTPKPGDVASINACDHVFCFDCIEKWAERENTCPLCKVRFTKIDRVHKKPRRTKAEVAAKAPVCKNTKTVKNRNQAADRGRIPIQDLIATMEDVPESAPGHNFFHLLFSSPLGSQLGLDLVSSGSSTTALGGNFQELDNENNFFSEDDESLDGEFQSLIYNRSYPSRHMGILNPFSSINLQQHNRGSSPDNPLEIPDSDDEDDDVMIIMNHNQQQQPQRPPTPHPYV